MVSVIDNGISAWNNSSANVSISKSSSSKNLLEARRYNDTWYGLTSSNNINSSTGYTNKIYNKG